MCISVIYYATANDEKQTNKLIVYRAVLYIRQSQQIIFFLLFVFF
jgi:hypothetical protein